MRADHDGRRYGYRKSLGFCAAVLCFGPAFAVAGTLSGDDTATGTGALASENGGFENTADGYDALYNNTTGNSNTAIGVNALVYNTTGGGNTASGLDALYSNSSGNYNTASGFTALYGNTTGGSNTAVGNAALKALTSGNGNIALGANAGINIKTGTGNIDIGAGGSASESHVIRIGSTQTKTFVAGIKGVALSGATVVVSASGQLGVIKSSARYKQNIQSLGDTSDKLAQLRPVSYEYKTEPGVTHVGLVAEEVDKVLPQLVVRDEKNRPDSVQYQELIPLLLQQAKAQQAEVAQLHRLVDQQRAELVAMRQALAKRLASLSGSSGAPRPFGSIK